MKLTQGTIIQGRKSGKRFEIIELKETKTIKWKGELVTKDIYIVKDLNNTYHLEKDSFKEMSSSIINKHYDIVKENNKCLK